MSNTDVKAGWKNLSWLLVKNRLTAQLGLNTFRYEKDSRKRRGKIAVAIAIVFCLIVLMGYCAGMAYGYAYIGLTGLIPGIALVICSLLTLFFTMFKANGELFGFKDYDMVMSLPVPVRTIINSRFVNMYLWNTFIAALVMLPMGAVYAAFAKPSAAFYIFWIIGILLASLIPTTIAAILGAAITAISSKFRYASAGSTILSILLIIAIMVLPMIVASSGSGMLETETGDFDVKAFSALAPVISESLNKIYPPARLFTEALVNGNIGSYLLFAGISIVWYALFVLLLSLKYRQINTALTSHISRADYKLETLHQGGMLSALYKKTIMRILKSTVCATNLLIGCVLAIIMSVAMLVVGPEKVMQGINIPGFENVARGAACYVVAAMVCMANTAAVSLALEGRNVWIVKSLPIPPKTLYDSYLLTNLTFTVPTSVLCSILISIALKAGFIGTALIILTPLTASLFTATAGIFIGNRMAYYNWQDETQLVKQSMMSMAGILGGMLLLALCGVIANSGVLPVAPDMITFIFNILFVVLAAVIYLHESSRPIKE